MKKQIEHYVGQMLALDLVQSNFGSRPVARTEEGIICLLDKNTKGFFQVGSTWDCEVLVVEEKKLIVKPIELLVTVQANEFALLKKLEGISKKAPAKKEKLKVNYQFSSKIELLQAHA